MFADVTSNTNVAPSSGLILLTILLVVLVTGLVVWIARR